MGTSQRGGCLALAHTVIPNTLNMVIGVGYYLELYGAMNLYLEYFDALT